MKSTIFSLHISRANFLNYTRASARLAVGRQRRRWWWCSKISLHSLSLALSISISRSTSLSLVPFRCAGIEAKVLDGTWQHTWEHIAMKILQTQKDNEGVIIISARAVLRMLSYRTRTIYNNRSIKLLLPCLSCLTLPSGALFHFSNWLPLTDYLLLLDSTIVYHALHCISIRSCRFRKINL